MISIMLAGEAFSSSVAVAPKRSGKIARPPSPKVKASGGEPTNTSSRRQAQHLLRVAVGDDQQVAVEMHGRLRLAGRARGEAQQRHIVASGLDRVELHRLVERDAIELGIVVGGAVEADDARGETRCPWRRRPARRRSRLSHSARPISALSTIGGQLAGAQHRHGVDRDGAGLGGRQPDRHHRRVVAGADQHAVAGLDAEVLDQAWASRLVQSASSL